MKILFRDSHLLAVHKPSGVHVHRTAMAGNEPVLQHLLKDQLGVWVFPVHRLDRGTSGVILFALSSEVSSILGKHFQEHRITKTYQAVVRGWTEADGVVDHPVSDHRGQRREALTRYRCLGRIELPVAVPPHPTARYSHLQLRPESGRRHQLRLHMKKIAHPIIGDTTHGDGRHNQLFRDRFDLRRMMLFATELSLTHPVSGEPLTLSCPPDEDLTALFSKANFACDPG